MKHILIAVLSFVAVIGFNFKMKYWQRVVFACIVGWLLFTSAGIYRSMSSFTDVTDYPGQSEELYHKRRTLEMDEHLGIQSLRQWTRYAHQNENTTKLTAEFLERARKRNNFLDVLTLKQVNILWTEFKSEAEIDASSLDSPAGSDSASNLQDVVTWAKFIKHFLVIVNSTTAVGQADADVNGAKSIDKYIDGHGGMNGYPEQPVSK